MNFPKHPTLFLAASFFAGPQLFAGETASFQSGEKQTMMIELFTSQGCSSCPPAEAWLNRFVNDPRLWTEIVPIAFHVDYWDDLGWKDPYATRTNTERQYEYRADGHAKSVYTPCFMVNGLEWKGWFEREPLPETSGDIVGILSASLDGRRLSVTFPVSKTRLDLNVAVLGIGGETDVARGENRGRNLRSDFVALHHLKTTSNDGTWSLDLPNSEGEAERYAIALWVTRQADPEPIQAVGGWLPSGAFN